jgi:hypothetical protein
LRVGNASLEAFFAAAGVLPSLRADMRRKPMESARSPVVPHVGRDTFSHEHAQPRRGLKHVVDALDFQRRALLVGARPGRLGDAISTGVIQ